MNTRELAGAQLDYWTARAEGHTAFAKTLPYSTSWALAGPLIEKHQLVVLPDQGWHAGKPFMHEFCAGDGDGEGVTPLIAICRAVVHAAFGDEVEDMP